MLLKNFLLVGLGGAAGAMLRYAVYVLFPVKDFPVATLLVNIIGSFIIGAVIAYSNSHETFLNNWKLFLATGICGGFTTFSAFSAENIALLQNGKYNLAFIYILLSVVLSISAAWLGFKIITNN
jgi:CrcB protein